MLGNRNCDQFDLNVTPTSYKDVLQPLEVLLQIYCLDVF